MKTVAIHNTPENNGTLTAEKIKFTVTKNATTLEVEVEEDAPVRNVYFKAASFVSDLRTQK